MTAAARLTLCLKRVFRIGDDGRPLADHFFPQRVPTRYLSSLMGYD